MKKLLLVLVALFSASIMYGADYDLTKLGLPKKITAASVKTAFSERVAYRVSINEDVSYIYGSDECDSTGFNAFERKIKRCSMSFGINSKAWLLGAITLDGSPKLDDLINDIDLMGAKSYSTEDENGWKDTFIVFSNVVFNFSESEPTTIYVWNPNCATIKKAIAIFKKGR